VSARAVTITGATGLLGPRLVAALRRRGDEVTVLSRDPRRAAERLGDVRVLGWDPSTGPPPPEGLTGADAVVNLAGAPLAQRWSASAKQAIRDSRVLGTRNLVAGIAAAGPRPSVLVSSSAIGYYGAHGEEPLDEDAPPAAGFLADVCREWEEEAARASAHGVRVACMRTGVVLDRHGGALAKMLPPFRLGVGGPVAGGRQYVSWVHPDDACGLALAAIDGEGWSGPFNATAPEPVTNAELARELGRALHRPAVLPVPGLALRGLYGQMAEIVTTGARVVPAKALVLGYEFKRPRLAEALRAALEG
jgi:uncharacterized protein (TIGR01777 family)